VRYAEGEIGGERLRLADFSHLPTRCKFIAFLPQWDFLNFLASKGARLPNFRLLMSTEAVGLLGEGGRVAGVAVRSESSSFDIRAELTIAADGRNSTLRQSAGLRVKDLGAPMDVMWFRLSPGDGHGLVLGRFDAGQAMVMLDRGDYWQCALIIRKGTADEVKRQGIEAFRARIARLARRAKVDEIRSLDDVKLLTVKVDRLENWCQPGLLFIGDAAHAMSPVGGVGVNLAIQDAVATANLLAPPLRRGLPSVDELRRVQARRMFPTRVTQALQLFVQNTVVDPLLHGGSVPQIPAFVRLMQYWPWLQRLPARAIGIGVRPEHVDRRALELT
jgi:2-polyprenyl-6-methoxyphenol hydroxylase-like FAD-dependent oxidoreductase